MFMGTLAHVFFELEISKTINPKMYYVSCEQQKLLHKKMKEFWGSNVLQNIKRIVFIVDAVVDFLFNNDNKRILKRTRQKPTLVEMEKGIRPDLMYQYVPNADNAYNPLQVGIAVELTTTATNTDDTKRTKTIQKYLDFKFFGYLLFVKIYQSGQHFELSLYKFTPLGIIENLATPDIHLIVDNAYTSVPTNVRMTVPTTSSFTPSIEQLPYRSWFERVVQSFSTIPRATELTDHTTKF